MTDPTRETRRSLLLRLAWRQSLLRLLLWLGLAAAVGWWSGEMAWSLLAAVSVVALRSYWRLFRVARFLDWRLKRDEDVRAGRAAPEVEADEVVAAA